MRWLGVAAVLAACGRIDFDELGPGGTNVTGRWLAVAPSFTTTCAIASDDSLWCWGIVGGARMTAPAQFDARAWANVALWSYLDYFEHGCGLLGDGSAWCWGANGYGQLGIGVSNERLTPQQVGTARWSAIDVGQGFSCGIQIDQSLWCWGYNFSGQLGIGTNTDQQTPQRVAGSYLAVATGEASVCAIETDHSLWCWGHGDSGELGNGAAVDSTVPVQVAGQWQAVTVADHHACAIDMGGSVSCWGNNGSGALGTGNATSTMSPAAVGLSLSQVKAASEHTCGVDAAGNVWCWGSTAHGALATLDGSQQRIELPAMLGVTARMVAVGGDQTCTLDAQEQLACTGRNQIGQLGPMLAAGESHVPMRADMRTDWTAIVAGGTHACGQASGTWCWGYNSEGEVGDGTGFDRQAPVAIGAYQTVIAGEHATIGLAAAGAAWQWGADPVAKTNNTNPKQVAASGWDGAAIGDAHACNLAATSLFCRGSNAHGQLGDGTMTDSANTQVAGTWQSVASGVNTTCGIQSGASQGLRCWGQSDNGQVGNGSILDAVTPQTLTLATNVNSVVAVGAGTTCAIDASHQLWCWGDNAYSELGIGSPGNRSSPVQVGTRSDWNQLAVGTYHACAIPSDGTLWCWGHAALGATGDPAAIAARADTSVPTQVGTDTDWLAVAAGYEFTCALKTDGTRWCFGSNVNGQLGNGLAWHAGFVYIP